MQLKRLKLFLMITLLLAVIAGAVVFGSPYAPVVEPVRAIEELWAIEDTRTESELPLVTALENHGVPLAYDREENTFYCSLGMDNGEAWPQLHLTAPDAQGVTICFSDGYDYDWCYEAVAEGYSYELMAYTDTEYSYFYLVFTGLPVVSISFDGEMTTEDIPVTFEMGTCGSGGLMTPGRAHLRGDGSLAWVQKNGYKVEFTRGGDGRGKTVRNVPGFVQTDELLLIPMAFDETLMLDRLSWAMYECVTPQETSFSAPATSYVEVFVNDAYDGVYLMATPFNVVEEMAKSGSYAAGTDSLYRTTVPSMAKDRPILTDTGANSPGYELFHTSDQKRPFAPLEVFIDLWNEEDDELFARKALSHVDVDSAVRYMMLVQACGLADNATNNLYIWVHMTDKGPVYRFKPWDMDRSWGIDAGHEYDGWFVLPILDRIVNLDVGGARAKLQDVWTQMKQKGFTYERVEAFVAQYMHELNDSGAFMRNTNRWDVNASSADGTKILAFVSMRFDMLDRAVARINESSDPVDFLSMDVRDGDPMVVSMMESSCAEHQDEGREDQ